MLAKWDEMALVGRVARAHGIRGQVIVNPETDFPEERFQPGAELFIERNGAVEPIRVTTLRYHRHRRHRDDGRCGNARRPGTASAGRMVGAASGRDLLSARSGWLRGRNDR